MLRAVHAGRLTPLASWDLLAEILDVLRRPKCRSLGIGERQIRETVFVLGVILPGVEVTFPLRDADDAPVIAAALVGNADAIVTGDRGLLDDAELRAWLGERGVEVLTPAELLERIGLA